MDKLTFFVDSVNMRTMPNGPATARTRFGPARSERAEASRQRILDAAARCFCELGYRRTRFEDVAQRAFVSRALVYNYFHNKENLLRQVRNAALTGWRNAVEPEIERATRAADKLRAMLEHTLRYARERPMLQAILTDDVRVAVLGTQSTARQSIDLWREQLMAVLRIGIANGEFAADIDLECCADVLRAMQMGVIDRMHRRDGPIDVSSEQHVEAMIQILLRGLEPPAARSDR
jgi:AcrR family transcriptional regulator